MCAKSLQSGPTLCDPVDVAHQVPGKDTGVGCHVPLQDIFPTQDSNPLSCVSCVGRRALCHYCHLGSPVSRIAVSLQNFRFKSEHLVLHFPAPVDSLLKHCHLSQENHHLGG